MATGTEEKLLTKAQLRANREIKTLRLSSRTPPGLPHAETLENKGKVVSFSLKSATRMTSQGQIKHPSSASALADNGKKQLPREVYKNRGKSHK